jgi:hypothetical protein
LREGLRHPKGKVFAAIYRTTVGIDIDNQEAIRVRTAAAVQCDNPPPILSKPTLKTEAQNPKKLFREHSPSPEKDYESDLVELFPTVRITNNFPTIDNYGVIVHSFLLARFSLESSR